MKKVVQVKNVKIGEGVPKICVPIVGKNIKEVLEEARILTNLNIDIVEWRVDFFKDVLEIEKVKSTLLRLTEILINIPILFTFRNKVEGGEKEVSIEYYIKLNSEIAKTKLADLIDVELFIGDKVINEIVDVCHKNNIKVVISNHDFNKTPHKEEIVSRLLRMIELKADLPKIAVMPNSESDVLTLLCATNEMKEKYPNNPIITMSMNSIGVISRISGEIFGSCLTFGSSKKASAPGQIEAKELHSVLQLLHKNM
ncbi:type I 3-dehydroquinate dehydratase [Clostridium taeniosporum]|uniref:3-dehydroquinate dehydratase n=1 Tax=Clostridium taeniosporum TaxID=394958 RepID=A0A1D7XKF5_9CLOT|nr:type I 3-dehydroquinate dehydratase [Clostridium taeniosporum]AOR23821.1 type I 3-dehydroquinate dehydratase [Clostridium taeniosporum]